MLKSREIPTSKLNDDIPDFDIQYSVFDIRYSISNRELTLFSPENCLFAHNPIPVYL